MKVCGQKMKITLPVYGRERTFSEEELIAILEKYFSREETKQEQETTKVQAETKKMPKTYEVADTPTEGKYFKVSYEEIDKSLFSSKRSDGQQERTRQLILGAFKEVKKHPAKYAEAFDTYMPKKEWEVKTAKELQEEAAKLGGYNGDWVEQALEWAQRINNGESWEAVCNEEDTANYHRLVKWKYGSLVLVGGSRKYGNGHPASDVDNIHYYSSSVLSGTVPFVVLRRKK